MPFVILDACVGVMDRGCVDECPVDCIYEADDRLLIHPDECIDCFACVPVCPVDAIVQDDRLADADRPALELARAWFAARPDAAGGAFASPYAPRATLDDGGSR